MWLRTEESVLSSNFLTATELFTYFPKHQLLDFSLLTYSSYPTVLQDNELDNFSKLENPGLKTLRYAYFMFMWINMMQPWLLASKEKEAQTQL